MRQFAQRSPAGANSTSSQCQPGIVTAAPLAISDAGYSNPMILTGPGDRVFSSSISAVVGAARLRICDSFRVPTYTTLKAMNEANTAVCKRRDDNCSTAADNAVTRMAEAIYVWRLGIK